jgi:serine/threonine protein kinase
MEGLQAETFAQRLRKGRMPFEEVLKYGAQIASALKQAHERGIVHRDLKPGNVMLTKCGSKLMDFGLAKYYDTPEDNFLNSQVGPSQSRLAERTTLLRKLGNLLKRSDSPTRTMTGPQSITGGRPIGTLPYMAPEQLLGKETSWRTDMFAFGDFLYEMTTGVKAFDGWPFSKASQCLYQQSNRLRRTSSTASFRSALPRIPNTDGKQQANC